MNVPGPSGNISGAMEVNELHMDGTREGKIFAPGYGEFSTGDPGGDLEAVSLASPTDSRPDRLPPNSARCRPRFERSLRPPPIPTPNERSTQRVAGSGVGCGAYQGRSAAVAVADEEGQGRAGHGGRRKDWRSAQSAALRVVQNELDLRLAVPASDRHVELGQWRCGRDQLQIDVAATTEGRCWPTWRRWNGCGSAPATACRSLGPVDAAMQKLRQAAAARRGSACRGDAPRPR